MKQEQYDVAMVVCAASYKQSAAALDQWFLAKAVFRGDGCAGARPLLDAIKDEAYLGDAELSLAYCDRLDGDTKSERTRLQHALEVFAKAKNEEGNINALLSLAQSHLATGELDLAVEESTKAFEAVHTASAPFDQRLTHRAFITVMDVASRIQDEERVQVLIDESHSRDWSQDSRGWLAHREATYYQEREEPSMAKRILEESMQTSTKDLRLKSQQEHLLTWLNYLVEDYGAALTKLDKLKAEKRGAEPFDSLLLRALIAAVKKDWKAAQGFLDAAEEKGAPDEDYRWDLERLKAELAEQMGDESVAIDSYRKTIRFISAARLAAPTVASFFVSSHRGPYEGLIALLAQRKEWREALKVVLLLDAASLLRGTRAGLGGKIAFGAEAPSIALTGPDPFAMAESVVDEVIRRWSARGVLSILVMPEDRRLGPIDSRARFALRIVIRDGTVTGEILDQKASELLALYDSATNDKIAEVGKTFAKIFLPDETETPVTILAIGRLGKLPFTWLQDDAGNLIVGKRSVSRTFGLREETEVPAYSKTAVVIAVDPSHNKLQFLARDAEMAMQKLQAIYPPGSIQRFGLGTSTLAPRQRLWTARNAEVFYLAAHVDVRERRRVILLDAANGKGADEVPARELSAAGLAPKLAVLANCGSAAAQDESGWGSVAAALIGAGSSAVVATHDSVDDAQSHALMSAFMSQPDWQSDPARALGRVQQMAKDGPINGVLITAGVWRAFMVITRAPYVPAPQTASLRQP